MSDWTSGYVADIGYTYGYYTELNPIRVKLAFLNAGLACPEFGNACELGFGQGLSTNFHAAASITSWCGTDFNPSQAGFAQELAAASTADVRLFDEAFLEFCNRADLPEFDYIGMHGIWSWISDENRQIIVDFIRKKLKVGGVLYVSYNTLPGWGTFAPMRHLMTEHAEVIGADGVGIVNRIDGALEFTEKLLATNPLFARANPLINEKIKQIKDQNRHYLAHEYFNRDWHPMHFASMAKWMESAKLTYACSANYLDFVDAVNLTAEQQAFLADIHDPMFKQTVRDFMVNQQFRKDYWVKGPRRITSLEQSESMGLQRVVLTTHIENISLKVSGALGEATLSEKIYPPILKSLSTYKAHKLLDLENSLKIHGVTSQQMIQAILILTALGHLSAVQEDETIIKSKRKTQQINRHLMQKARSSNEISYLSSPVTGGGMIVGRFHQLFLLALQQGKKNPEDMAAFVAQILTLQGQKIVKSGKPVDTSEEQLAELTNQANDFTMKHLPILKALQIA